MYFVKNFLLVLCFCIIFYSDSFSATKKEKIEEVDKMFVSGLLSKEECIKFKKVILGEDSKPSCEGTKTKSLTIKNPSLIKEPLTVMHQVKALGIFTEPTDYPVGMVKLFGNSCNNFHCRSKKATQKMAKIFKRDQRYHQRHPGEQLYAMAMFELFYQQKLKKDQKKIEKFISVWPDERKWASTVVSLIKLNKSREQMRKALGMDLNTSIEEAMERYWIMGDFLEKGEIKKQKISKDIKKRGALLAKYKKAVVDFKSSIQKQEDEKLYDKIKKKND